MIGTRTWRDVHYRSLLYGQSLDPLLLWLVPILTMLRVAFPNLVNTRSQRRVYRNILTCQ